VAQLDELLRGIQTANVFGESYFSGKIEEMLFVLHKVPLLLIMFNRYGFVLPFSGLTDDLKNRDNRSKTNENDPGYPLDDGAKTGFVYGGLVFGFR
jgi:hypothetical protein